MATPNFLSIIDAFQSGQQVRQRNRLQELSDQGRQLTQQYLGGDENALARLGGVDPGLAVKLRDFEADQQYRKDSLDLQRSKANEPPTSVQEYQYGQKDPAYLQYQQSLKRAGANNVTINNRAENEFQKKLGGLQAERVDALIKSGSESQGTIAAINQLRDIGSRIQTGKRTEILAALGPYAQAVGVNVEGLDDAQAYDAIVARLAPQMRVPGSGATSDFEMGQFIKSLPGLGKTPEGNKLIQDSLEGIAQWKQAAGQIAAKAARGQITRDQMEAEISQLPDPLTLWRQGQKAPVANAGQTPAPAGGEITIDLDGNVLQ